MKPIFALAAAAAVLSTVGCMPDYNPSSFIEKYRVVGIMAEPPAVDFTPEYQGSVELTLIDAFPMPPGDDEIGPSINGIEWSVCLISAGAAANYACTVDEIPLTDVSADGRTARFDGALIAFGLEMLADSFEQIIDGLRQAVKFTDDCNRAVIADYDACLAISDATECNGQAFQAFKACIYENGLTPVFRVKVSVTDMLLDDADMPVFGADGLPVMRDRIIQAFKTAVFGTWTEDKPANRNPEFSLRLGDAEWSELVDITHPEKLIATTAGPREQPEILACPGETFKFQVTVPPGSIDLVDGEDGTKVDEYWLLSWYANNGRLKKIRTGSVTAEGVELDLTNSLYFDDSEPVATTTVTVVMRDEQYGLNHLDFVIRPKHREDCFFNSPVVAEKGGK